MYSPTKGDDIFNQYLDLGFEKSNNPEKRKTFEISAPVYARICKEEEKEIYLAPARSTYTLYVGGMGAKTKNFYFNLLCDYGYKENAERIQDLYLAGDKQEAEKHFPEELLDDLTLVGSKESIVSKLENWKQSNVTELSIGIPLDFETIKFIIENLNE